MARTIRNEFDKRLTYDNLMKAHKLSKKGKGYREEVMLFNLQQEEYLIELYQSLKEQKYKHGGYTVFYITQPKLRKIEKSKYIDRIVHRWVVDNFIEPYFVPTFVHTSYACIKNRGMHKACLDLQKTMLHCQRIWKDYYVLKMDVKKYFQNINKDILLNILNKKVVDSKLQWLIMEIIYSNEGDKGLPIGNYTSQMFANIYLNEVDQYIKNQLKCKYYFRYMDDSIILVKTKEEAKYVLEKIQAFLKEKLELELNNKTQIFKSKQGVNFCGYKINEYRLKIRDKRKKETKEKSKKVKKQNTRGKNDKQRSKKIFMWSYRIYTNSRYS